MMRFFKRVISPTIPEDPLEGAVKGLFLSQFITAPMTLTMNYDESPENCAISSQVIAIHFAAILAGYFIGMINMCLRDDNQANRQPRP